MWSKLVGLIRHTGAYGICDRAILNPVCEFSSDLPTKTWLFFSTCSPRSLNVSWLDRLPLFDRKSREWKLAIADCLAEWKTLLPNHEPINGSHLSDYITGGTVLR